MRVKRKCEHMGLIAVIAIAFMATLTGYSIFIYPNHESAEKETGGNSLPSAEIKTVESPTPPPLEIPEGDIKEFEATAYCDLGVTFSGVYVQRGIVAADPRVLPIGSVIEVSAGDYSGIYTVMDTGGVIKGEIIDIFMPDYEEAVQFGRQKVQIRVIRKGWLPDYESVPNYDLASTDPASEQDQNNSDTTL